MPSELTRAEATPSEYASGTATPSEPTRAEATSSKHVPREPPSSEIPPGEATPRELPSNLLDGLRCWLYEFGVQVDEPTGLALAGRPALPVRSVVIPATF